ncbi:hypothetical protein GIB67_010808 [Kingdonia uniflora]|uniref:EF-hand domain-containing protein n=1 Tax=Kingdonia uniflora TaxID=39325 RepID=A0A7J7L922_9MAGN|nr:hypothetical protein GIB67_010808 [Kingdonia uniflora]
MAPTLQDETGLSTDEQSMAFKPNCVRCVSKSMHEMTVDEFKQWLKQFDRNGDGRISRDELREAIRSKGRWFTTWNSRQGVKSADANHNGFIDDNEIGNLLAFAEKKLGLTVVVY